MPRSRKSNDRPAGSSARPSTVDTKAAPAARDGRDEFFRLSQAAGHVGSWEWNLVSGEIRWSPEMYRLHGRDVETFALTLATALACYHPEDRARLEGNIPRVLRAGRIIPGEVRVVLPDGGERVHWVEGRVEYDDHRRAVRMLGVNVDITERRRVEQDLRESEERYRRLSEAAFEGICVSEDGVVVEANARLTQLLGFAAGELDGRAIAELVAPECRDEVLRRVQAGVESPFEHVVLRKDGSRLHIEAHGVAVPYRGRLRRVTAVRDISERRTEAVELERENRFRHTVIENAGNGICVCHEIAAFPGTRYSIWNSEMVELTGYTMAEVNLRGGYQLMFPDPATQQRARDRMVRVRAGDDLHAEAWELTRADGTKRQVLITTRVIEVPGDVPGVLAVMHDITATQRAERELAARARQQAVAAQLGLEALSVPDADTLLREAVPLLADTLGVDFVAVFVAQTDDRSMVLRVGTGWGDDVVGTARIDGTPMSLAGHTLLTGDPVVFADLAQETRFAIPDLFREHGIVSGVTAAISGRDRPWGVLCVGGAQPRDYSRDDVVFLRGVASLLAQAVERDHTEQALRVSEERYRTLVDDARDAIFGLAADRTILWANAAAETITGWARADWVSRSFVALVHPEDAMRVVDMLRGLLAGERPAPFELRLKTKGGVFATLEFNFTAQIVDGRVLTIMGIGRDLTERLRLEAQLRQSQKMQSVGQLAGGVAHDFNNVLQAITGFASIALRPGIGDVERGELLEEILAATLRGGDISRQLLTFSRQQPLRVVDVDLGRILASLLKMLRRLLGEHVELRFECDEGLANIRADRAQLEQVVVNLCVNARDAMPGGGHMVIEARNRKLDAAFVADHPWARAGEFVELVVTDIGTGMDEITRERIFEPFFTTKPTGQGTGLGLAVVYGIVQEHAGLIHVDSEPGRGTEFHVFLPVSERLDAPVVPAPVVVPEGGDELILLAEDEPAVRRMVERVLKNAGYRVLAAADGDEALVIFNQVGGEVALVILDAVMPKVGGFEAHRRMAAIRPQTRVLFCSGYSAELATGGARLPEGAILLQKPYSMDELLNTVRRILVPV